MSFSTADTNNFPIVPKYTQFQWFQHLDCVRTAYVALSFKHNMEITYGTYFIFPTSVKASKALKMKILTLHWQQQHERKLLTLVSPDCLEGEAASCTVYMSPWLHPRPFFHCLNSDLIQSIIKMQSVGWTIATVTLCDSFYLEWLLFQFDVIMWFSTFLSWHESKWLVWHTFVQITMEFLPQHNTCIYFVSL